MNLKRGWARSRLVRTHFTSSSFAGRGRVPSSGAHNGQSPGLWSRALPSFRERVYHAFIVHTEPELLGQVELESSRARMTPGYGGYRAGGSRLGCPAAWRARELRTCDFVLLADEGSSFCLAGSALLAPEPRAPSGNASASPPVDHPPEEAHSPQSLKKPEAGGTSSRTGHAGLHFPQDHEPSTGLPVAQAQPQGLRASDCSPSAQARFATLSLFS